MPRTQRSWVARFATLLATTVLPTGVLGIMPFDGWGNNALHPNFGAYGSTLRRSAPVARKSVQVPQDIQAMVDQLYRVAYVPDPYNRNAFQAFFGLLVAMDVVNTASVGCPLERLALTQIRDHRRDNAQRPGVEPVAKLKHDVPLPCSNTSMDTKNVGVQANATGNSSSCAPDAPIDWPWQQPPGVPSNGSRADPLVALAAAEASDAQLAVPLATSMYRTAFKLDASATASAPGDDGAPRAERTLASAFLDASFLYGNTEADTMRLRSLSGGTLALTACAMRRFDLHSMMDAANGAGAGRHGKQMLPVHALVDVWARFHNYIAAYVLKQHPGWGDEQVFQRARMLVRGVFQHVVIDEYLPSLGVQLPPYTNYQPGRDASLSDAFVAAFRAVGHAQTPAMMILVDGTVRGVQGCVVAQGNPASPAKASINRMCHHFSPSYLGDAGDEKTPAELSRSLRGMLMTPQNAINLSMVVDLRRFATSVRVTGAAARAGALPAVAAANISTRQIAFDGDIPELPELVRADLAALDVGSARDHGVGSYNEVRRAYSMRTVTSFAGITADTAVAARLASAYANEIDAVDLVVGGLAENSNNQQNPLGPLFSSIIYTQFDDLRYGDRYWYENFQNIDDGSVEWTAEDVVWVKAMSMKDVLRVTGFVDDVLDVLDSAGSKNVWSVPANLRCNATVLKLALDSAEPCSQAYLKAAHADSLLACLLKGPASMHTACYIRFQRDAALATVLAVTLSLLVLLVLVLVCRHAERVPGGACPCMNRARGVCGERCKNGILRAAPMRNGDNTDAAAKQRAPSATSPAPATDWLSSPTVHRVSVAPHAASAVTQHAEVARALAASRDFLTLCQWNDDAAITGITCCAELSVDNSAHSHAIPGGSNATRVLAAVGCAQLYILAYPSGTSTQCAVMDVVYYNLIRSIKHVVSHSENVRTYIEVQQTRAPRVLRLLGPPCGACPCWQSFVRALADAAQQFQPMRVMTASISNEVDADPRSAEHAPANAEEALEWRAFMEVARSNPDAMAHQQQLLATDIQAASVDFATVADSLGVVLGAQNGGPGHWRRVMQSVRDATSASPSHAHRSPQEVLSFPAFQKLMALLQGRLDASWLARFVYHYARLTLRPGGMDASHETQLEGVQNTPIPGQTLILTCTTTAALLRAVARANGIVTEDTTVLAARLASLLSKPNVDAEVTEADMLVLVQGAVFAPVQPDTAPVAAGDIDIVSSRAPSVHKRAVSMLDDGSQRAPSTHRGRALPLIPEAEHTRDEFARNQFGHHRASTMPSMDVSARATVRAVHRPRSSLSEVLQWAMSTTSQASERRHAALTGRPAALTRETLTPTTVCTVQLLHGEDAALQPHGRLKRELCAFFRLPQEGRALAPTLAAVLAPSGAGARSSPQIGTHAGTVIHAVAGGDDLARPPPLVAEKSEVVPDGSDGPVTTCCSRSRCRSVRFCSGARQNALVLRANDYVHDRPWQTLWAILLLGGAMAIIIVEAVATSARRRMLLAHFGVPFYIARISAQLSLYCLALLAIARLKRTWTFLRDTLPPKAAVALPVDQLQIIHNVSGYAFCLLGFIHTIAHCVNMFVVAQSPAPIAACAIATPFGFREIVTVPNLLVTTIAGLTGLALVAIIIVMLPCSLERMRRGNFKLFHAAHRLFWLVYPLILAHGAAEMLAPTSAWKYVTVPAILFVVERYLQNVSAAHNTVPILDAQLIPGKAVVITMQRPQGWSFRSGQYINVICSTISETSAHPFTVSSAPQDPTLQITVKAVGPWTQRLRNLLSKRYNARRIRAQSSSRSLDGSGESGCAVLSTASDPDTSVAGMADPLYSPNSLRRRAVAARDSPSLGAIVDRAPGADTGVAGAPTKPRTSAPDALAARHLVECKVDRPVALTIEGPHGAPSQQWERYRCCVLVAGGIGVTPMLSVLSDVLNRIRAARVGFHTELRTDVVEFLWVARSLAEASWLKEVAKQVEENDGDVRMIRITLFITAQASWRAAYVQLPGDESEPGLHGRRLPLSGGEDAPRASHERTREAAIHGRHSNDSRPGGPASATNWTGQLLGFRRLQVVMARPDFGPVLQRIKAEHADERSIGIFACGPKPMLSTLARTVRALNVEHAGPALHAYEETF